MAVVDGALIPKVDAKALKSDCSRADSLGAIWPFCVAFAIVVAACCRSFAAWKVLPVAASLRACCAC